MAINEVSPIPSGAEVLNFLKSKELQGIQPLTVSADSLKEHSQEVTKQQIIDSLYWGIADWAEETLLKQLSSRPEMKLYSIQGSSKFAMEISSWDKNTEFSMWMIANPRDFADQIEFIVDDLYLINNATNVAVSVRSLLPPYENFTIPIAVHWIWENPKNQREHIDFMHKNRRSFGVLDKIALGEVHVMEEFFCVLHEAGHLWTTFLEIFATSQRQTDARRANFSFADDARKNGVEASLQAAQEIGFSERMANIIGRILYDKIKNTDFFSLDQKQLSWNNHDDVSGSSYDARHAHTHLPFFERIRSAFVSRFNRTDAGKEAMISQAEWIGKQIEFLLDWTKSLTIPMEEEVNRNGVRIQYWKKNEGENSFYVSIRLDADGRFKSARVKVLQDGKKISFSITAYDGIQFTDTTQKPHQEITIDVGRIDPELLEKQSNFESIIHSLNQTGATVSSP